MKVAFRKKALSWYSKIIQWYTFGPYCHVEIVFSNGLCFSSSEDDNGTRFKTIDLVPEDWDVVDVPCDPEEEADAYQFCLGEQNSRYDWRGIMFSFLPIPIGWQSADKWFCSEIVAAALQEAGFLRGYTPAALSPNQLYKKLVKELS